MRTEVWSSYFLLLVFSVAKCSFIDRGQKYEQALNFNSTTGDKRHCSTDSDCMPWTFCNNSICVCRETDRSSAIKCNENNLQISVLKCNCATYDNTTGVLSTGKCIEGCANATYQYHTYTTLPEDPSQINRVVCEDNWNRTGRLCGKCLPGYGPLAYSYDMRCIKCPEGNANIWKYLLVAYGPLTLFYFIVLFFKINAISSHLHGFLYYSQAVSMPAFVRVAYNAMVGSTSQLTMFHIIVPMYSTWSLDILRSLQLEICLDVSTLALFAMDYALTIYPMFLTIISYILIELHDRDYRVIVFIWRPFRRVLMSLRRNWNIRNTIIDAYTTFFMLSFMKLLTISVDILTPTRATDLVSGNSTWVLYYDGTVDYFGAEHLPYAILTIVIIMLMIVAPTALLVLYQFKWFQRFISCLRVQGPIFQTFMDSFQGCYKDGTEPGTRDHRWFVAVPLIGHIIAFSLMTVTLDSSYFPWVTVITISFLLLTIIIQPYKSHVAVYTKIDAIFLAFLVVTYTMIDAKNLSSLLNPSIWQANSILLGITFTVPIISMIGMTIYRIVSRMKRGGRWMSRLREWRRYYRNTRNEIEDNMPDRLINPKDYEHSVLYNPVNNSSKCESKEDILY